MAEIRKLEDRIYILENPPKFSAGEYVKIDYTNDGYNYLNSCSFEQEERDERVYKVLGVKRDGRSCVYSLYCEDDETFIEKYEFRLTPHQKH